MPKIIDNLKERLLEEARRQVMEQGYSNMNIRSIAAACGVGVGTVYNYYPSKDALIAGFMARDWKECLERIKEREEKGISAEDAVRGIYHELKGYYDRYTDLFHSPFTKISAPPRQYHAILRGQIAQLIQPYCGKQDDFAAEFAAEAMLAWTIEGKQFEDIYRLIRKVMDA